MELTRQQKIEHIVRLKEQGLTYREIVKTTGYSLSFLIRGFKEHRNGGISAREVSKMKTKELADKMAVDRITMRRYEVAEKYGLSESYVHVLLKNHPLKDKFILVKRNKTGVVKQYTKEQWDEAVLLRNSGVKLEVIAERLDMNLGTIRSSKKMVLGVRERAPVKQQEDLYNQVAKDRLTMSTQEVAAKYNKSKRWVRWIVNKRASEKPDQPYFYKQAAPRKPKPKKEPEPKPVPVKQKKVKTPSPEKQEKVFENRDPGPHRSVYVDSKTTLLVPLKDKRTNKEIIEDHHKKHNK